MNFDPEKLAKVLDHVAKFSREWNRKRQGSKKELVDELYKAGINYFQKYQLSGQLYETLQGLSEKYAEKVVGCMDEVWVCFRLEFDSPEYVLEKINPMSDIEAEMCLKDALKELPEEDHEFVTKIFWAEYMARQRKDEQLTFRVTQSMKDILMKFFSKEILDLKPEHLRVLTNFVHVLAVCPFVDELFSIRSKYEDGEYSLY
jgi:hypothetical protein